MIRPRPANAFACLLLVCSLASLTGGCGQKGPLYLPTSADAEQQSQAECPTQRCKAQQQPSN